MSDVICKKCGATKPEHRERLGFVETMARIKLICPECLGDHVFHDMHNTGRLFCNDCDYSVDYSSIEHARKCGNGNISSEIAYVDKTVEVPGGIGMWDYCVLAKFSNFGDTTKNRKNAASGIYLRAKKIFYRRNKNNNIKTWYVRWPHE